MSLEFIGLGFGKRTPKAGANGRVRSAQARAFGSGLIILQGTRFWRIAIEMAPPGVADDVAFRQVPEMPHAGLERVFLFLGLG